RASGADRDARGLRQLSPEDAGRRMGVTPLPDEGQDLGVAAAIVTGDPAPRSDRSAEAAGEVGALAQLPLGGDKLGAGFAQHLRRDDPIGLVCLVAGGVVMPVDVELPDLASEPGIASALDRAEIRTHEYVSRLGAQRRTGELRCDRERIAPAGDLGKVFGKERVDQTGRILRVIAPEIVQLRAGARPPTGGAAVDAPPAADA